MWNNYPKYEMRISKGQNETFHVMHEKWDWKLICILLTNPPQSFNRNMLCFANWQFIIQIYHLYEGFIQIMFYLYFIFCCFLYYFACYKLEALLGNILEIKKNYDFCWKLKTFYHTLLFLFTIMWRYMSKNWKFQLWIKKHLI